MCAISPVISAFTRTPRGRARRPVGGRPVPLWVGGLPHFDQMTVGIADVAADLVLVLFRRRQELSTPGAPFGVHGLDVFDPDIEEAADPVGIAWRLQGDRRLVVGRASADVDDDPAVGQRDIGQPSGREDHPAAEHFGVEAPRALDIVRDDEVGQHNSLWGRCEARPSGTSTGWVWIPRLRLVCSRISATFSPRNSDQNVLDGFVFGEWDQGSSRWMASESQSLKRYPSERWRVRMQTRYVAGIPSRTGRLWR